MIKRKYRYMRICEDRIDFADVENTITYSLCPDKLEKNLNKREDELCNKISDLEAKFAESEEFTQGYRKECAKIQSENIQLKQQLEESEKKNFELITKLNLKEHRPAFCTLADRECEALGQVEKLEQQLAEMQNEKDELISKYRYWRGECAELKEQLAKEQKHISRLKNMNKSHDEAVGRLTEENNQLKQQLAEKEKEIEQLNFQINVKDGENAELERRIYELDGNGFCTGECWYCDYYKEGNDGYGVCTYKANQDKISFCIEQLELAKKIIDKCVNNFDDGSDCICAIDNQIKQLKEMK